MLSDWRVIDRPLAKADCLRCGLLAHREPPTSGEIARTFGHGYALYAHAPGRPEERRRQQAYAEWIAEAIGAPAPARLLEVGCGNGSLLLELAGRLPGTRAAGVDPSPEAVEHAKRAGVAARCGFAADAAAEFHDQDVVLSVNVIEHTPDPAEFLRRLASTAGAESRLVVVCPDGAIPSTEMLVFDHLFSFTEPSLAALAGEAGLRVDETRPAPAALGPFTMHVLRPGVGVQPRPHDAGATHAARADYLRAWARLDDALGERTGTRPLTCFGTGEAAGLIRAYAPRTWARIERFTVDAPAQPEFGGRPVTALEALVPARDETVLLAVRARDQAAVAGRLGGRGMNVVRWDDLVSC
jgi:SAM-dependent methyltransferase